MLYHHLWSPIRVEIQTRTHYCRILSYKFRRKRKYICGGALGCRKKGKVLKLKKTLDDLHKAHHVFWKYPVEKLKNEMSQLKLNSCLFIKEKSYAFVMLMIWYSGWRTMCISMNWQSCYVTLVLTSDMKIMLQVFLP